MHPRGMDEILSKLIEAIKVIKIAKLRQAAIAIDLSHVLYSMY